MEYFVNSEWIRIGEVEICLGRVFKEGDVLYEDPYVAVVTLITSDDRDVVDATNLLINPNEDVSKILKLIIKEGKRQLKIKNKKAILGRRIAGHTLKIR